MNEIMTNPSLEASSPLSVPLEKIALETYVPPAKPSLVGLSRAEIADQLGAIGVAALGRWHMRTGWRGTPDPTQG